jgi:hypothetical protein
VATQQPLVAVVTEAQRLAGDRVGATAEVRAQEETVKTLRAMLREQNKILKALNIKKRKAEDAEEAHRAAHDLEVGAYAK